MKKTITILISVLLYNTLFAQIASDCNAPAILQSEYQLDVTDLAIKRMYEINSPDTALIEIPQTNVDTILEGLAAIFNAPSLQGKDDVFDAYCIHQDGNNWIKYQGIDVYVDTNYAWTQQWQDMQTITGYTELDNFLSNYGFTITQYFSAWNRATLTSNQYINFLALCDSLNSYDGISSSYSKGSAGYDGNRILYEKPDSIRYYDFSLRYGDCYSSCICRYTWKYKVYPNCSVEFIGIETNNCTSYPFPSPTNCNISTSVNIELNDIVDVNIYPNPSTGKLIVESKKGKIENIEVLDITGKTVKQFKIQNSEFIIDLSNEPKGIYFVKLIGEGFVNTQKVVLK